MADGVVTVEDLLTSGPAPGARAERLRDRDVRP